MKFGFTIQFVKQIGPLLLEFGPLIITMVTLISVLAIIIGRQEKWSLTDSLYFGFITSTTVGYGDFCTGGRGRWPDPRCTQSN
jgi:predicted membrane protein